MSDIKPPLDPHPLSKYVAWAGNRNKDPILRVFKDKMPKESGKVLEMASGSGMHVTLLFRLGLRCATRFFHKC
jgi:hypothetical protein